MQSPNSSSFMYKFKINRPQKPSPRTSRPHLNFKGILIDRPLSPLIISKSIRLNTPSRSPLSKIISRSASKSPSRLDPKKKPEICLTRTPTKSPSNFTFVEHQNTCNVNMNSSKNTQSTKISNFIRSKQLVVTSPTFSNITSQKSLSYSDTQYFKFLFNTKSFTSHPEQSIKRGFTKQRFGKTMKQKSNKFNKDNQQNIKAQLQEIYKGKFKIFQH